ncbi:Oxidoreductase htatip2 [Linderina macrospora]|uniref:Oxidoreductase htatip2 n=1 Tax=Linderina macrospora TaxID=4868 RepID=A0ACC1JAR7_9FUNG|nr:Oxidoreductase htatip2 [Linderina macrospora]
MASVVKILGDSIALSGAFRRAAEDFSSRNAHKSALVLGATGEVGREVVGHLLASGAFEKVTVFVRRPIEYTGPNADKLEQKAIDFEDTATMERDFAGHTHAFSCLGTTRGKSGADGFYKIDHDYTMNAAKACKSVQVEHYSICSSAGANKDSFFLYPKTKGQVDHEVSALGFPRVSVFRPAMLECDRGEGRWAERLVTAVLPVLKAVAPKSVAVKTSTVGWAMVNNAFVEVETPVAEIISNADMLDAFANSK